MSPENFCYFLQGYLETSNPEFISAAQTQIIKDHLALVFNKVTPDYYLPKIKGGTIPGLNDNALPIKILDGESVAFNLEKYNREKDFNFYYSGKPPVQALFQTLPTITC